MENNVTNKENLRKLLNQIFADAIVEHDERVSLKAAKQDMAAEDVKAVFSAFATEKWGEANKDGIISAQERTLLHRIISELDLEADDLPPMARFALKDEF